MSEGKEKSCTRAVADEDLGDSEAIEVQGGDTLSPLPSDSQPGM